ncbi:8-oxo-dGTP diphosphatase MutT [Pedobacter sp. JY14-1]|uniref:8-oxo-dGTP diphosphatase MutT n=1 Tax=Pedobacter sp. JY14-1 TaxID=3034151 RepID=UPI0023E2BF1F|nr:8-oxo-dGTP diphosphatase MutT [Pedobacter sp. JY14-1]
MIPVAAAVIYKDEKILIARRAPGKHMAGYWEFPGGKIEPGETPGQCLLREIREELGISISVGHFLGEHLHDYGEKQVLLKAYRCAYASGELILVDHDEIQWVLPEDLSQYRFAPADIPFIDAIRGTY